MRLVIDSSTFYTAHFSRGLPPQSLAQMTRNLSICAIHLGDCKRKTTLGFSKHEIGLPCNCPSNIGVSRCSDKDQFNSVGHKIAFTRAIANFDTNTRSRLWQEYLKRWPPQPSRPMKQSRTPVTTKEKADVGRLQGGAVA